MEAQVDEHEALVKKAVAEHSVVALVGGLDSGKTTLSRQMMREALGAGRIPAYLDADLGQKSVGPPTTVGLKLIRSEEDLDPARLVLADACYFVGAISPQGNLLGINEFPEQPANCTFGGKDNKTLYATARTSVYSVPMGATGHVFPAGKR